MQSNGIEISEDKPKPVRKRYTQQVRKLRLTGCEDDDRLRRETDDAIPQRLFSILLAAHAAEASVCEDSGRLPAILELIRIQSAASLDDIRRLMTLR